MLILLRFAAFHCTSSPGIHVFPSTQDLFNRTPVGMTASERRKAEARNNQTQNPPNSKSSSVCRFVCSGAEAETETGTRYLTIPPGCTTLPRQGYPKAVECKRSFVKRSVSSPSNDTPPSEKRNPAPSQIYADKQDTLLVPARNKGKKYKNNSWGPVDLN
ncbi:hypothetical protein VTL71DRAFT_6604 [Oculimacula yallundae]|uniref:Uncharacterized protein n=1 Tax=Oculimacula yallundae TaxID=86028 RepID=A0ABR4BXG0_9HELO